MGYVARVSIRVPVVDRQGVLRSTRRRRRWWWITAGIVAVAAVALGVATAGVQFGVPWSMQAGDRNHVFDGGDGRLRYQVHLPPQYDESTKSPVVMALHGCGMTGFGWNSMKLTTRFNGLAHREGFIVVYPTQRMFRNAAPEPLR
jgi:poly(3-hydroxybutyrate) depolymerase